MSIDKYTPKSFLLKWLIGIQWVVFISVGVGKCQSEDSFVCYVTKPTQRACAWDFPQDRKRTSEGKSQGEQNRKKQWRNQGIEQTRTVERTGQSAEQGSRQKRAGARACGLRGRVGQRERMSQYSWWLCGNFIQIHTCDSSQNAIKVSKTSLFLHMELTTVYDSLFFFSSPLSVVYVVFCVSVKKCEILLARDERNHQTIRWPWVV